MEENNKEELEKKNLKENKGINWSLQDFFSVGYLYLLVIGIAGDSIYYSYLGVNIISYSSVVDVLLSPIIKIINVPLLGIMLLSLPAALAGLLFYQRKQHLKKREDPEYQEKHNVEKLDRSLSIKGIRTGLFVYTGFALFGGFIGFGWGGGAKMKERIETGDFKTNRTVYFIDGDQKNVRMIGHNSEYLFYIEEGEKALSVIPIPGNIKAVKRISKGQERDSDED
ncbi:MAG: hypothetical protein MRZ79_02880 [Bacteroidia bacterium]|nr:hypothetical protein [Bacteroidia bacterium]